jgi:hypothetical protein
MTTDFPAPAFAGQSPGRGDGAGGRGGGGDGAPEEALDEPHPGATTARPIAAIVRSSAAPPATRPIPFRNSRRAILAGRFTAARLRLTPAASPLAAFYSSSRSPDVRADPRPAIFLVYRLDPTRRINSGAYE